MTMIKWINAGKLHEITEVLILDLQNLVPRYLILISMKMKDLDPLPPPSNQPAARVLCTDMHTPTIQEGLAWELVHLTWLVKFQG